MNSIKGFMSLSLQDKLEFSMPYINTTLLIDELINLQHEDTSGVIRISEKGARRKDRYSSLSYNYYVSLQLEKKMRREDTRAASYEQDTFTYRAPRRHKERW